MSDYVPGVTVTRAWVPDATAIEAERIERCRPSDPSAAAAREALTNIARECASAKDRLDGAQEQVARALLKHPNELRRAREAVAAAQDECLQYGARRDAMQAAVEKREAQETEAAARLAKMGDDAEAAAAKFRAFVARDYAKAAATIAAGLALEREAIQADTRLREAARAWPGVPHRRPDIPRAPDGATYGHSVNLPGHVTPASPASPYVR